MTDPMLVADIGGTNARFALGEVKGEVFSIDKAQSFRAEDYESVRDAADAYLESVSVKPKRACFAVAGPIDGEIVDFTNSHWTISQKEMEAALKLDKLLIVNDFYAMAAGVQFIGDDAFELVKEGPGWPGAPTVVMGPGTGLGQALIVPTRDGARIVSTEGGHVAFAPRTDEELEVLKFVAKEHPRVSVERLLSGRGLVNIHRALCVIAGTPRAPLQANEITAAALEGKLPIAVRTVDLFCEILGRVAGDAVLATGARGGVILAGGILPKVRDIFMASKFIDRFTDKGRMSDYVEMTPVRMLVKEGAALFGAAAALEGRLGHD